MNAELESVGQREHAAVKRADTVPLTHHGRTTAAWAGSGIAGLGFIVSTVGFLMNISWPVVWAGLGLVALGAVVGGVLVKMGHGAPVR